MHSSQEEKEPPTSSSLSLQPVVPQASLDLKSSEVTVKLWAQYWLRITVCILPYLRENLCQTKSKRVSLAKKQIPKASLVPDLVLHRLPSAASSFL